MLLTYDPETQLAPLVEYLRGHGLDPAGAITVGETVILLTFALHHY